MLINQRDFLSCLPRAFPDDRFNDRANLRVFASVHVNCRKRASCVSIDDNLPLSRQSMLIKKCAALKLPAAAAAPSGVSISTASE
jgi:hypothetical protein